MYFTKFPNGNIIQAEAEVVPISSLFEVEVEVEVKVGAEVGVEVGDEVEGGVEVEKVGVLVWGSELRLSLLFRSGGWVECVGGWRFRE